MVFSDSSNIGVPLRATLTTLRNRRIHSLRSHSINSMYLQVLCSLRELITREHVPGCCNGPVCVFCVAFLASVTIWIGCSLLAARVSSDPLTTEDFCNPITGEVLTTDEPLPFYMQSDVAFAPYNYSVVNRSLRIDTRCNIQIKHIAVERSCIFTVLLRPMDMKPKLVVKFTIPVHTAPWEIKNVTIDVIQHRNVSHLDILFLGRCEHRILLVADGEWRGVDVFGCWHMFAMCLAGKGMLKLG